MQKQLFKLLFIVAILFAPWTMRGQTLESYRFTTGVDTTRWITLSDPTFVWSSYVDDAASSVMNMGFDFILCGDAYSQFSVSSNGIFHLGSNLASTGTQAAMFNSSYYSTSLPKISGIARDLGTGSDGYVKYQLTGTSPNRVFVCEFAMGYTYGASYSGDVKWQIQLHEDSSRVVIVYGPVAPVTTPTSFQIGLGAASDDIAVINPTNHTIDYVNGPTSTTYSTWPGAGRYYDFVPSVITCQKPFAALVDSITSTSALFSWQDTSGAVEWAVTLEGGSSTFSTTTFDSSYHFTGLSPLTSYTVRVASICDVGDTSLWRATSFRTPCADVTLLPFSETFEGAVSGSSSSEAFDANCLMRLTDAGMYYYPYVYNYSSYAHSGNQSLYWYNYSSTDYGFQKGIVMPGIDTNIYPMDTLQFSFWARSSSTSYYPYFQVGVLTSPNDMSTFQLVENVAVSNMPFYTKYIVTLSNYQGNGKYICIRNGNSGSWTAYVDDFTIEVAPECPAVRNIAAQQVNSNSARVVWSELDTATSWQVSYRPTGTSDDSLVTVIVTDTFYTLTDLMSNTEYTVIISPICEGTAGVDSISFRTHCAPIMDSLPYTYGFETPASTSSSSPNFAEPSCWHRMTDAYLYYYPYISSGTYAHSGNYGLYWYSYYYANSGYGSYQYVVLPEFDSVNYPIDTLQVRFWAKSSSSSYFPIFYVGVVTNMDDPSSFVPVQTVNVGNSTLWHEYDVPLTGYTGPHGRIAIAADISSSSTTAYLDDFTVEFAPACERPDYIVIRSVDESSITLDWTAPDPNATAWQLVYGPQGFDPTSDSALVETATAHPWTINGLAPGTAYDVYISTDCGDGQYSAPRPFNFLTACTPIDSLPYIYGFEGTATGESAVLDPCWVKAPVNTTTNYPYPSSVAYEGSRSLYFYGYFSSNVKSYAVLPMFEESTDMLQVSFRLRKSQNYSYYASQITVGLMQSPYDISTFTPIQTCVATSTTVWDSFSVILYGHADAGRYIAFLSEAPNSTQYYNYVYLDSVAVDLAPDCGPVTNVQSATSVTSAILSWTPSVRGESLGGTVEYRDIADSTGSWDVVTTASNIVTLTNLDPSTTYEALIYNNCADGNSPAVYYTFTTGGYACAVPDTTLPAIDTIAGGTSTSTYLPIYSFYQYGLSQQIFLANELPGLGSITSMRLQTANYAQTRVWDIYLSTTSENSVSSFLPVVDPVLVYSDTVIYASNDWIDFNFTTPFTYDGAGNLLVTVVDRTGSYVSGNSAYTHNLPGGRTSCYAYRDGTPYQINDYSSVSPYTLNVRNNMIFSGYACGEMAVCAAPAVMVTGIHHDGATIEWVAGAGEGSWELYYMQDADTGWTYVGTQYGNSYTFSGLGKGLSYKAKVVTVCDGINYPAQVSFFVPCPTIDTLPFFEDFNSYTSTTYMAEGPDCWHVGSDYGSYPYFYTYESHGGSGASMYMYNGRSGNPNSWTYVILPAIDSSLGNLTNVQATFWAMNSYDYYQHYIVVGVTVDPDDISTFTPVDTFLTRTNRWEMYECTFERYADSGRYITFASMPAPGSYCYPYLDDITIDYAPPCQRPNQLRASVASSTSVTLSWRARSEATQFAIEYGPVGFTPGTGTQVVANSNPFVLTGLPAGYQGEYRVRNICGAGDTSDYSQQACIFTLPQVPATIPYSYNFENATEWSNWHVNSNNQIFWSRGTATPAANGNYSMYVSPDYGATFGTDMEEVVNTTVWRDFNFGTTANAFELSFKHKEGGTISADYDALMVIIADTTNPVVASEANITSPWGDVNSINYIFAARLDTNWTSARVAIDSISGVKRVAFFWFNQDQGAYDPWAFGPAAIDDIEMIVSPCPRVQGFRLDSLTSTTATLSWNATPGVTYRIAYRIAGSAPSTNQYVTATTNNVTITGLSEATTYIAFVQKICGSDSSIFSDGITFQTNLCESAEIAYSYHPSDGPSTSNYLPIGYSTYNYSYVQTIIDADLLADLSSHDIVAMAFNSADGTSGDLFTNMDIYLANVTENNLSAGFIMPDTNHQFVQMTHSADLTYTTGGWHLVGFDTTFTWDGHSNVLLSVNRRHGSWVSGAMFRSHSTGSTIKSRYLYQDSGPYDPTTISPSSGTAMAEVGDLQFFVCGVPVCPEPTIAAESHDYRSSTITWSGEGAAYEVNIKATADTGWSADIAVGPATTYTFSGLLPATEYTYRVRTDCSVDSIGYSVWVEGTFTTDSLPCFIPTGLHATAATNTTVTLDWTVVGFETAWDIHVWLTGGLDSIYRVTTRPATVGGFIAGLTYNAAIRPLCGLDLIEGEWSDTVTFATATCPDVTNFTTSNVTANSITLNWTADPMAQGWIIEYGFLGFNQGTGTTVNVTTNSYVATGLLDETDYQFYIRAVCGTDWTSENWASATATTQSGGVPCGVPTGVSATAADNSITVNWTSGTGNLSFEIEYGPSGFNHGSGIVTSAATAPATLNNLEYETPYDIYVRAICDQNTYSGWSIVATATTGQRPSEDCQPVTNLTVTDITDHTAHVAWTPAPETDSWQVVVTDPQGNDVVDQRCAEPFYDLTGLTEGTNYTVKVRTDCGDGNVSAFVSTNFRTTGGVGISDVTTASCTIFPNPTSNATTISVSGVNGRVKIEVVDMNGRVAASETLECSTDCTKTMDVDRLAQGAYFVRITADNVNMVRKLIVR